MTGYAFTLHDAQLIARASGALCWPDQAVLCVSDLHLGKSGRIARRDHLLPPPYETLDTLHRLSEDLDQTGARHVICLGDSFDDLQAAQDLPDSARTLIARLQAGRRWTWIEGNHDPGPVTLGGTHQAQLTLGPLTFRHIADPQHSAEVSGHYHPKLRTHLRGTYHSCPVFLLDANRLILPAFGTYTGGLSCTAPALQSLMTTPALAITTGKKARPLPMPRAR